MNTKLEYEFSRYCVIAEILEETIPLITPLPNNMHITYYEDIWERVLLAYSDDYKDGEDVIFAERKLKPTYQTNKYLLETMTKYIPNAASQIFKLATEKIAKWLKRDKSKDPRPRVKILENFIRVYSDSRSYNYALNPDLINYYKQRLLPEDLALIIVRYACVMDRVRQWSTCPDIYSTIINVYGVTIEGFSAPHNYQMFKYKDYGDFCSIFNDIDKLAGSLGSFFDQDFVGKNVSVFPPYSHYVMERLFDFLNDTLTRAENTGTPTRFFVLISGFFQELVVKFFKSKYTKKQILFPANELYAINVQSDSFSLIPFDNHFYIFSFGYDDHDYSVFNNIPNHIKAICANNIAYINKIVEEYDGKSDFLDLSKYISKYSHRTIKQFLDTLVNAGKIPTHIMEIFEPITVNRNAIMCHMLIRIVSKFNKTNKIRFAWSDIEHELQLFVYELLKD